MLEKTQTVRLDVKGGKTSNPSALKYNGDGTWTSNQGIIYGQGSKDGNRVRHVLIRVQEYYNPMVMFFMMSIWEG